MASNPVTCADAGAHIFNAMGFEVQLVEINRDLRGELKSLKLAQLARGKSRLDRLNQVAKDDIRQRIKPRDEGGQGLRFSTDVIDGEPGTVDEVEVYLAYHSGLKARLKLPWVSPHMSYRATADVSLTRLNHAFDEVMRLETGDGLVDGMLEQPLWDRHLRDTHAAEFQASLERANALIDPLDDLLFAQNQWASAGTEERSVLQPRLLILADALTMPHADVLSELGLSETAPFADRLQATFAAQQAIGDLDGQHVVTASRQRRHALVIDGDVGVVLIDQFGGAYQDRKSTRLNSSHGYISYAVFCLKKKNNKTKQHKNKKQNQKKKKKAQQTLQIPKHLPHQ